MEATTVRLGRGGTGPVLVPVAGLAVATATIAYGFAARADGTKLGASLAPFLWDWRPSLRASALPAVALLAIGVWLAPRLRVHTVRPWVFAAATLALGLALRLALGRWGARHHARMFNPVARDAQPRGRPHPPQPCLLPEAVLDACANDCPSHQQRL